MKTSSLWSRVIKQKYLYGVNLADWIREPRKVHTGGSVIWKAIIKSFHLIESKLAWDIGNGEQVLIGRDPWVGSFHQHVLPDDVVEALRHNGFTTLNQLADPRPAEPWN